MHSADHLLTVEQVARMLGVSEAWYVSIPTACVARRLSPNSRASYESAYRVHIEPAIGNQELQYVNKNAVDTILGHLADAGRGKPIVERVLMLIHELFTDAVENGYVSKNPARQIVFPTCKAVQETVALSE